MTSATTDRTRMTTRPIWNFCNKKKARRVNAEPTRPLPEKDRHRP
jgi:hypothetical protein